MITGRLNDGDDRKMAEIHRELDKWRKTPDMSTRIVAFGASNTAISENNEGLYNWVEWLNLSVRKDIGHHVNVINAGKNGDTTVDLLNRTHRDALSFNPEVVILTIGANDAAQGFTSNQYRQNLMKVCSLIQEHNAIPMLQTYYCPVYHEGINGFRAKFECFMEINRELAMILNVPLIEQYEQFKSFYCTNRNAYKKIMRDWIHLNHIGNYLMACNAIEFLGLHKPKAPKHINDSVLDAIQFMS